MAIPALESSTDFSLRSMVREALDSSDEADPHVIAEFIVAGLSVGQVRLALEKALPGFIREVVRSQRNHGGHPSPTSARWDNVAELQASGELTLLRVRVFCGVWKFLGDCTRDDVKDLAERRETDAADLAAMAERFKALRSAMQRKRAATVADLPGDVLNEIFDA